MEADVLHGVHADEDMRIRIVEQSENACAHLPSSGHALMHDRMPEISSKVRSLRKRLKLKQAAFAEKLGVDQATVSRWENGGDVKPENLFALAELAGQTIDDFLKIEPQPEVIEPPSSTGPSDEQKRRYEAALKKMSPQEIEAEIRAVEARVSDR
ncbi:helix-turn-helix domain-containing protein [Azospirillum argentinense]|uniref:helix-turn-helix domain-containing protein n=1 Tax=Azospirillum argentinense TaxID=2970906 RepID=UPI0032DF452D